LRKTYGYKTTDQYPARSFCFKTSGGTELMGKTADPPENVLYNVIVGGFLAGCVACPMEVLLDPSQPVRV